MSVQGTFGNLMKFLSELDKETRILQLDLLHLHPLPEATEELVLDNERLAAMTTTLQGLAGSGEQLARVVVFLGEQLPPDFWVTRIETSFATDAQLGVERGAERHRETVRVQTRRRDQVQPAAPAGFRSCDYSLPW